VSLEVKDTLSLVALRTALFSLFSPRTKCQRLGNEVAVKCLDRRRYNSPCRRVCTFLAGTTRSLAAFDMSKPPGMTLRKHRATLAANPNQFSTHRDKTVGNLAGRALSDYSTLRRRELMPIAQRLADQIWEAQGGRPLFEFIGPDRLHMSWNRPAQWDLDYIQYEVGHMKPVDAGGSNDIRNLCFQSGRCNIHLQASLDLDVLLEAYFCNNSEVTSRVSDLRDLHSTKAFRDLYSLLF